MIFLFFLIPFFDNQGLVSQIHFLSERVRVRELTSRMHRPLLWRSFRRCINKYTKQCTCNVSASTFSPLASAFDNAATQNNLNSQNVGLFCVPELKTSDGFHLIKDDLLARSDELVNLAIATSPSPHVISLFDTLSNELCKVADLAEFIRGAHTDPEFAQAAEATSFGISGLVEKLNTHYELYVALRDSSEEGAKSGIDAVTEHVARLFLYDFEQSGIHLHWRKRNLSTALHDAIIHTGAYFTKNTASPRKYPVSMWPRNLPVVHQMADASNILVDSVYSESSNPRLREHCYKAYMSACPEQEELLGNLLAYRQRLASTLGFPTYAHRYLLGTMAGTPDNVVGFLDRTLCMLEEPLQRDMEKIRKQRHIESGVSPKLPVDPWDVRYYTNLVTTQQYELNGPGLSEYFSVGACMEGLNIIFTSLYGVSLCVVPHHHGEVWARDVQKVEVRCEVEGVLGYIYCDFYQRSGKLLQDCHYTIRGGKLLEDGTYQTPIVCLMCNFRPPSYNKPSLLSLSNVENLFHEMGHAMHSMLGRARYQHVTGTRCATDFAEVPSILMEYFCRDPRILKLYAKHYKTGKSLPENVIRNISASRNLFSAIDLQGQAFYSMVDQRFHAATDSNWSMRNTLDDIHKDYSPVSHAPHTSWHLRFSHFHSYGAKYYSYPWCKAVASRVWFSCFEADPLSRCAGDRYRATMLCHGGGRHPQEMVDDMLGMSVSSDHLVNALQYELTL